MKKDSMKKILTLALMVFGFTVSAQEGDVSAVFVKNQVVKTAYESATLSLKEKIEIVNQQVESGFLTESEALYAISQMTNVEPIEYIENVAQEKFDAEWQQEENPFEFAMGVEVDTLVKYRRTGGVYVSFGFANAAVDGAFANSEFGYLRSNSLEWGLVFRTPFNRYNNKWGIRYGLGVKYNGLATTQNREFALNGNQTVTSTSGKDLKGNSAVLRNTYINIPISLDFTTTTKTYNKANRRFIKKQGFNFGIGGYIGYNIGSQQHLRYENAANYKIYEEQKGDWNVNDFQYGLSAYAGLDWVKLVFNYDLNPVFKNNPVDQNYWSLGIRLGM